MCCSRVKSPRRLFAGLLGSLLLASFAVPLEAQAPPESHAARSFGSVYDIARETTLNGTIKQVVTQRVIGSPVGTHLLVSGPGGVVDTHVGPFLTEENKNALHTGTPVQIVGATIELSGKEFFLAREVKVGGRTITIRNQHGLLVRPHVARIVRTKTNSQPAADGGAR